MGGENRETRWVRSRAGLLQSARDFHLVFVTFGALQLEGNFGTGFSLLGTAFDVSKMLGLFWSADLIW